MNSAAVVHHEWKYCSYTTIFRFSHLVRVGQGCCETRRKRKVILLSLFFFFEEKPRLKSVNQEVRTVPSHYVWCTAEGTPPINISLLQSFTNLALRVGLVYSKIQKAGNFTCRARNEAGTDSRDFSVVIGKNIELT